MSNSTSPIPSLEEVQAKAVKDLSQLNRVSHKLAMTEGAQLEKVLSLLLPRLLLRVGSNHALQQEYSSASPVLKDTLDKIHAKLVETFGHIMQRVRADETCQLAVVAILELLYDKETYTAKQVDTFTMNLALMFLNLGVTRCPYDQVELLLPGLLVMRASTASSFCGEEQSASSKSQAHQIAHLLLKVMERLVTEERVTAQVSSPPSSSTLTGNKLTDTSTVSGTTSNNNNHNTTTVLDTARRLCSERDEIVSSVFDLCMDVLLYQPSSSTTMPPPGLSQAGHELLLSNKEWATAMRSSNKLQEYKNAILNIIIPTRKWAIFMNNDKGLARTVAFMVVASGDAHATVVERATLHLKAHLDTMRERNETTQAIAALGEPLSLSCTLLSLITGDSNAEAALSQVDGLNTGELLLGRGNTTTTASSSSQVALSFKRRMANDQTAAAVMNFVSQKVLNDNPLLLDAAGEVPTRALATLAVMSCNKLLSTTGTSTLSTLRATPYIAAAQLLNTLCIRLTALESPPVALLAKSMMTVCNVLTQAATPRPSTLPGTFEGSIAMRDACYGVVSALCRSRHAESFVFTCGKVHQDGSDGAATSMDTAKLLFACAANEAETLRPRAVAALDALLGAYCRVYVTSSSTVETGKESASFTRMEVDTGSSAQESNPWSNQTVAPTVSDTKASTSNTTATVTMRDSDGLARALLPLLWSAAQSSQPKASRVAAARWSTELLKTLNLPNACHILCFLAGDKDVTASSIARGEGLGLDSTIGEAYDERLPDGDSTDVLPDFSDLAVVLFSETTTSQSVSSWRPRYFDFSYHGKAAAVRFGLVSLFSDLYGGEDDAVALYLNALSQTLRHFGTASGGRGSAHGRESIDLLDECSICLAGCLSTSRFARSMILSGRASIGLEDMEALAILADSSKARRYLAEACGHIYEDLDLWRSAPGAQVGLDEWVEKCRILRPLKECAKQLKDMQSNLFQIGEVHGSAFLGARCCRAFRLLASTQKSESSSPVDECWESVNSIVKSLGQGTIHSDEIIGNAFSQGLSVALSYDGVDAPILDPRLFEGTTVALTVLDAALRKYSDGEHTDETRTSTLGNAIGVVLAASTSAAGYVSDEATAVRSVGPARIQGVDAIFNMIGSSAFRKDPEVALVAGEALADYADAYGPENAVWSSSDESDWPDTYSDDYANELPPHEQVLYVLIRRELNVSSPHKRTAVAQALLAVVGRAAKLANSDKELAKRVLVVAATRHIAEIQSAFIKLLADPKSKQMSRESCCIGLAACQGIAQAISWTDEANDVKLGDELNESLLRAFGQTTNFGGSAMMETSAQNAERRRRNNEESGTNAPSITEPFGIETEVGGAAGLGEAALGAYREMAAAALALGRSDVLYALFLLSISHAVWFTAGRRDRYSAATLLGEFSLIGSRTNSAEMREALRPHLSKLIPRMLRACHDPNKQTREQMNTLWLGVTGGGAESRKAITENLLPTIDILMEDAANKLWRARVGACGALAEVIVGRSWNELGGGPAILDDDDVFIKTSTFSTTAAVRLLRLWRVATRALDDVRLSVRESGETLARSVRSLTIRLCDPSALHNTTGNGGYKPTMEEQQEAEESAKAAAATCLRWLVKHGLNQPCAEAVGVCVSCLLGIVEVVQPATLQPVLSDLIGALLMAMSGLEPAALNYLQVRSAGRDMEGGESYDRLERARLQMASSGPIAGALNKCLDMVPSVELSAQREVIPQFDSALRSGVGFATRAATADAVSSLCAASPNAFSFPGHGTNNPTVRLLRALYYASEREHGQGARDKMAHALGNLAAISPGQSVRSLALRACDRYSAATGNNDDPVARRAAASALRALAVRASNQLADGGPRDIWCRRVLPLAFLGQRDTDSKVASLWKEVWDEGGIATHAVDETNTGSTSFGVLLEEKLLPDLVKACVDALNDVSWARRVSACAALTELCDQNILAPVPRSTRASIDSMPSSEMARSKRRAQASLAALSSCVRLMAKPRVWTGKADVVKTVSRIASQWVIVCSSNDMAALGWNDNSRACPWMPVSDSQDNFGKDLFTGDGWFENQQSTMDVIEPDNEQVIVVGADSALDVEMNDTKRNKDKIDFEKGDDLLASDAETEEATSLEEPAITSVIFAGLCRALLEQAFPAGSSLVSASLAEDVLPYRASSLTGLSELLRSLSDIPIATDSILEYQIAVYRMIAPTLLPVIGKEMYQDAGDGAGKKSEPPLIVARSIDCLASAFWKGIGKSVEGDHPEEDVLSLAEILRAVGGSKQPAWTVRQSSVLGAARLTSNVSVQSLRNPRLVDILLDSSKYALSDRKFWRVRLAGLELLLALVKRAGDSAVASSSVLSMTTGMTSSSANPNQQEKQLALEALLPHKETILQLARSSLTDSEANVTSKATEVCSSMAWWP